ncbi:MAG: FecCD family ABC transporter permease [Cetobacterium sp.]
MKFRINGVEMKKINFTLLMGLLIMAILIGITFSILLGSVNLSPLEVWKIFINKLFGTNIFQPNWNKTIEIIVWKLRAPRIIMSLIVGGSLSLVGILMQVLTKNTLADPYILGISSGASTGAILVIILGGGGLLMGVPIGAFMFSILTAAIVFFNSGVKSFSTSRLVLTGVAVSSLFSGITTFLVMTSPRENQVRSAMFWMVGSLSGSNWSIVGISFLAFIISLGIIYPFYRELNIMLTGDETALTLGVDVKKVRWIIVLVSTLLTGFIVSNTGIIGFVGLVIPHISRGVVGSNHKKLIPFSVLLGGLFLLITDDLARSLVAGQEIPIGVITAILGAPFFLWLIRKNDYKFGN